MLKRLTKSHFFTLILLLVLIMPAGVALAEPMNENSARLTATPIASLPFAATPIPGVAQVNVTPQIPDTVDTFTFSEFGFDEITMRGPFAANGYYFDLPLNWRMKHSVILRLVLDSFYTEASADMSLPLGVSYGGTLLVQYNYINVATIDLDREGRKEVDIPIPLDLIARLGSNKGQSIQLILDSGVNCDVDFRTTVIVRSTSQFYLPHDLIDPPVDLRLLPSPFYQNSYNQDSVIVIVPDEPSPSELQAALSVAAGFGRMTFNRLLISLIPASKATDDILKTTNLIFVGKAAGLPMLQHVALPVKWSGGAFVSPDSPATDGFIQMAVSPWNKAKVVMSVGGNEDVGVMNAARALSTGALQVGGNSSLSVVSNAQLLTPSFNPTEVNQTFDNLGYESAIVGEVGLNTLTYTFNIPQSYTLGPDAYLDLFFSHSALLEYQRSSIIVKLNDQPIGSARFSEETSGQGRARIVLPASAVRPGVNSIRLEINLEPYNECVNPLLEGLWVRIDSSSMFHLPFVPSPGSTSVLADLGKYPFPFAFDPLMKDLAFVLAPNDPTGWNIAAQLALGLGYTNAIQISGLEVYYADSIPESARQERNLIIIGKPSELEILTELYDFMPAPFEPGTNLAVEKNLQVSYRLSEGVDVGYLELFSAPWNSKRILLYVGGSTDLGLQWAGAALQFGRLRGKLDGNLAFINGEQIISADTRVLQGAQSVLATIVPVEIANAESPSQPVITDRPAWIIPAIFVSLGGIVLVLILVGVQSIFKRRSGK